MTSRTWFAAAAAVHLVSWFLPVHKDVDAGWRAFVMLWPAIADFHQILNEPLSIFVALSPHTNYVPPIATILILRARGWRSALKPVAWALGLSLACDAYYLRMGSELRIGYFFWLISFALFLWSALVARRERPLTA